jgi:hypothetical protein
MVLHDVAGDGRALVSMDDLRAITMARRADDPEARDLSILDQTVVFDMSADGSQLLLSEQSAAGHHGYDIYLRAADGSPPMLLGEGFASALSPDDRWVASVIGGKAVALLPVGTGKTRRIELGLQYHRAAPLDGRRALVLASEAGKPRRFYRLEGDEAVPVSPEGSWMEWQARGSEVLARNREGKVWALSAEGGEPRLVATLPAHHDLAHPAPEGRWYVIERGLRPGVVRTLDLSTGQLGEHRTLAARDSTGYVEAATFVASDDGAHHAYTYFRLLSTLFVVDGMR